MGSAMLRKPRSLAKMVAGVAAASELPVTVKVRGGGGGGTWHMGYSAWHGAGCWAVRGVAAALLGCCGAPRRVYGW